MQRHVGCSTGGRRVPYGRILVVLRSTPYLQGFDTWRLATDPGPSWSLDRSSLGNWHEPAVKYHYLHRRFTHRVIWERWPCLDIGAHSWVAVANPRFVRYVSGLGPHNPGSPQSNNQKPRDIDQMGSLAGAARLLQHNAGVLKHCSDGTELSQRGEGQRCC